MKWMLTSLMVIVFLAVGLSLWARLAPSDPDHWHVMPNKPRDINQEGGALRAVAAQEDTLARLHDIIMDEPRTTVLAGSIDEGMITYITRSALFGFPDYTTVWQNGSDLAVYGRLRIGYSDMGVNAARIDRWLALLGQGGG